MSVPKFGWHDKCLWLSSRYLILTLIVTSCDEVIDELLAAEKAAGTLAKKLGASPLLPFVEGTCSVTGRRHFRGECLKASVQYQIHIGGVLKV